MKWLEIAVHTHEEAVEALSERLHVLGAGGVSIEDATTPEQTVAGEYGEIIALDRADYPESGVVIKAYFSEVSRTDSLLQDIKKCLQELVGYGLQVGEDTITTSWVDEEDWENAWKAYYKPTRVTDRLVIVPVWENDVPIAADALPIYLDPGMAFGTGTHPTTRLTLQSMEKYLQLGQKVIDVGCGSGILSIAAEKLGASEVLALDLDPVAVTNAQQNCQQNDTKVVTVSKANLLQNTATTADMIVANILAEILLQMVYDLPRLLRPGGIFIGSGIIASKQEEVTKGLETVGLTIVRLPRLRWSGKWNATVVKEHEHG